LITHRDIWAVARHPARFLETALAAPLSPRELLLGTVTPLVAIRAVAVLVRSLIFGAALPGFVLGTGSFVLQLGAWLGLALVMPAIARQFDAELAENQSFALATYASVPLWLAGLLYVIPEDPWYIFLWSRGLVLAIGSYGLYILRRGLVALQIERKTRTPMTAAVALSYATLYLLLFILLGIAQHVVFYVLPGAG
jgi:hypothetical protein